MQRQSGFLFRKNQNAQTQIDVGYVVIADAKQRKIRF